MIGFGAGGLRVVGTVSGETRRLAELCGGRTGFAV